MLRSSTGKPYRSKDAVSRALSRNGIKRKIQMTSWGPSKMVSMEDIEKLNKKIHVQRTNAKKDRGA